MGTGALLMRWMPFEREEDEAEDEEMGEVVREEGSEEDV